jgi:hypothetical protein
MLADVERLFIPKAPPVLGEVAVAYHDCRYLFPTGLLLPGAGSGRSRPRAGSPPKFGWPQTRIIVHGARGERC